MLQVQSDNCCLDGLLVLTAQFEKAASLFETADFSWSEISEMLAYRYTERAQIKKFTGFLWLRSNSSFGYFRIIIQNKRKWWMWYVKPISMSETMKNFMLPLKLQYFDVWTEAGDAFAPIKFNIVITRNKKNRQLNLGNVWGSTRPKGLFGGKMLRTYW